MNKKTWVVQGEDWHEEDSEFHHNAVVGRWHRLNDGYAHATEPYSNVISTPLIMHIPGYEGPHIRNELISAIDIKDIILKLVETDAKDIADVRNRGHIFSRNLYAAQKGRRLSLNKGYSVANEEYLLMVTHRGLELYNHVLDPQNTCNILEFYKMDKKGNIVFNAEFKELKSGHFLFYFRTVEINHVIEQYKILRQSLLKEVHEIYGKANISRSFISQELAFNKICNMHGYRLYNHRIASWIESRQERIR